MSRIESTLAALKAEGRTALIPYITAGDPHPNHTVGLMHALVDGGADIIELGVPFSDPMADGPTIQLACERALLHDTSLWNCCAMVAEFRKRDSRTPVVLMGYLNPIETRGLEAFCALAKASGVDGVLIVDLAVEEAPDFAPVVRAHGLDLIFLLAPTSSDARIDAIVRQASGYLYYVSLKGVTGAALLDVGSVEAKLGQIRRHTSLPIAVGFGIRDAASAALVGTVADGVVVGSALVSQIEKHQATPAVLPGLLKAQLAEMRAALDAPATATQVA
ncbi:MAG: tryptophan synthase subunit alpha [Nevskia sp.]|uniref:tryptophan synthase subunit alpha n=1 Tax=Nevskia sp. TaxID=1929292 RepID=UPI0040375C9C